MDTEFQIRLLNRLEQSIDRLNERLDGFDKTITEAVTPLGARVQTLEVEVAQLKLIARAAVLVASIAITGVISIALPNLFYHPAQVSK
jgi:hypothetical protein